MSEQRDIRLEIPQFRKIKSTQPADAQLAEVPDLGQRALSQGQGQSRNKVPIIMRLLKELKFYDISVSQIE